MKTFREIFNYKPIIGMIHLAGKDKVKQALKEISLYEEENIGAVIIEDYHAPKKYVYDTLDALSKISQQPNLVIGINVLSNPWQSFAYAGKFKADFVQFDYIAGRYEEDIKLDLETYSKTRKNFPNIAMLGGVWPKYYQPVSGSNLEDDLKEAMGLTEAIVVTGDKTGKETPLKKIKLFRNIIGVHPLIVGAGLNHENVYEQLSIADGGIVGSCFKENNSTSHCLDKYKIRDFMDIIKDIRNLSKTII